MQNAPLEHSAKLLTYIKRYLVLKTIFGIFENGRFAQVFLIRIKYRSKGGRSVVVDVLFNFNPIVGFCNCSMFCCTFLYVPSSFAIILMGKRGLVALRSLSSRCLVIVVWLFLSVPWVSLQFVIVVFPDRTHLLFLQHLQTIMWLDAYELV